MATWHSIMVLDQRWFGCSFVVRHMKLLSFYSTCLVCFLQISFSISPYMSHDQVQDGTGPLLLRRARRWTVPVLQTQSRDGWDHLRWQIWTLLQPEEVTVPPFSWHAAALYTWGAHIWQCGFACLTHGSFQHFLELHPQNRGAKGATIHICTKHHPPGDHTQPNSQCYLSLM